MAEMSPLIIEKLISYTILNLTHDYLFQDMIGFGISWQQDSELIGCKINLLRDFFSSIQQLDCFKVSHFIASYAYSFLTVFIFSFSPVLVSNVLFKNKTVLVLLAK